MKLQPSVVIATCRKTYLSQIILLQYKAKPYPDCQNLWCHCKIVGCHFDTKNGLKKHCFSSCFQFRLDFGFRSATELWAVAESSGVTTGLSQGENLAAVGPLVTVGVH